jgi:hypothetical protein
VEWLRDNGARGLVAKVESWYYAAIAPSTGGPALRALPHQPGVAASPTGPCPKIASVSRPETSSRFNAE